MGLSATGHNLGSIRKLAHSRLEVDAGSWLGPQPELWVRTPALPGGLFTQARGLVGWEVGGGESGFLLWKLGSRVSTLRFKKRLKLSLAEQ